jgi:hypothetical protein
MHTTLLIHFAQDCHASVTPAAAISLASPEDLIGPIPLTFGALILCGLRHFAFL